MPSSSLASMSPTSAAAPQAKKARTAHENLQIVDIRDSSQRSLAASANLAPLIVSKLSTKATLFPASSVLFDKLQNGSTSPFHLGGGVQDGNIHIRSIPTLVLYDDAGLDIYDQITYVEEYYLTNAEMQIFMDHGSEIMAECVQDGGVLIELGVGSMRKTKYLLDALVQQGKTVTYYALDLSAQSLAQALNPLAEHYPTLHFIGLLGTYDDSLTYIERNIPRPQNSTRTILWLGSSIGNDSRTDAAAFLRNVKNIAMDAGDTFLCGIDRRNPAEVVKAAYDDPKGVTRDFILNGLSHVERILGCPTGSLFQKEDFEYVSLYNDELGRHEAYYRSLRAQRLEIPARGNEPSHVIHLQKGELINVEYSVKYNSHDVQRLVDAAGFYWPSSWTDATGRYDLHLFQKAPFSVMEVHRGVTNGVPTLAEFEEIFKCWDCISGTMIQKGGHLDKPISLRHPYVFYLGHLPAFMDIQLARCLKEPFLEPTFYTEIFERGIDPDVNDPSLCHAHSTVPDTWPAVADILEYAERCKERIRGHLRKHESGEHKVDGKLGRVLWMNYEHYAMHLETFLYMLIQSPNTLTPHGFKPPVHLFSGNPRNISPAAPAAFLRVPVPEGVTHISTGHNDSELDDPTRADVNSHEYGWDNEHPHRLTTIPADLLSGRTRLQTRQVTVGEYRAFWEHAGRTDTLRPASWTPEADGVKTAFGIVEAARCVNWPVYVSGAQGAAYAAWVGEREGKSVRLPSEVELLALRDFSGEGVEGNYGFRSWVPRDVREVAGVVGDGWELTGTVMEEHEGYEKSVIYPGYTSDFFDGKHNVVLGGSWATAPRIATRRTFRNWYQRVYPYVFAGFRLAVDE